MRQQLLRQHRRVALVSARPRAFDSDECLRRSGSLSNALASAAPSRTLLPHLAASPTRARATSSAPSAAPCPPSASCTTATGRAPSRARRARRRCVQFAWRPRLAAARLVCSLISPLPLPFVSCHCIATPSPSTTPSQVGPAPDPLLSNRANLRTGFALAPGVSKAKLRQVRCVGALCDCACFLRPAQRASRLTNAPLPFPPPSASSNAGAPHGRGRRDGHERRRWRHRQA